jgi:hypothetical protein
MKRDGKFSCARAVATTLATNETDRAILKSKRINTFPVFPFNGTDLRLSEEYTSGHAGQCRKATGDRHA